MDNTTFGSTSDTINDKLHGLSDTASRVTEKVSDTASRVSEKVSETIDDATSYLRDDLWDDTQRIVKANPVAALVGAVAVGFIVGRLLRR